MSKYVQIFHRSLAICFLALTAHGQVLVDQSLQFPPMGSGHGFHYAEALLVSLLPVTGQEFTPSFNALNFVGLTISATTSNSVGTFEVAIHHGDITSPVLGLSSPTTRSSGFSPDNNTRFDFLSTVPLTPGDTYVLELLQLSGDTNWGVIFPEMAMVDGQPIDMTYAGGRMIYNGVPQNGMDILFQEGLSVPEPRTLTFVLLGIAVFPLLSRKFARHT